MWLGTSELELEVLVDDELDRRVEDEHDGGLDALEEDVDAVLADELLDGDEEALVLLLHRHLGVEQPERVRAERGDQSGQERRLHVPHRVAVPEREEVLEQLVPEQRVYSLERTVCLASSLSPPPCLTHSLH